MCFCFKTLYLICILDYFEHQNHQLKAPIQEKNVPLNRLQKKKKKKKTHTQFTSIQFES